VENNLGEYLGKDSSTTMDVDAINNAEVYSGQNSSVLETKVQEFTVQCPSYKFKEWDVMCAKPTFKSVPQTISRDALSQKKKHR
jgi:hypothetical protein